MASRKTLTLYCLFSLILSGLAIFELGDNDVPNYSSDIREYGALGSTLIGEENLKDFNYQIPFPGFLFNAGQINNKEISYYFTSKSNSIGFGQSQIFMTKHGEKLIEITFPNSNHVFPEGRGELSHQTNYYFGDNHISNVKSVSEVWFPDIYEKIDLRYYMSSNGLKYDFIVHPGGNPDHIQIEVSDDINLEITKNEATFERNGESEYIDTSLYAYQLEKNNEVKVEFNDRGSNIYGFKVGNYNRTFDLIIDPLVLGFSTYFGGDGADLATDIQVDNDWIFITGTTGSTDFPTMNEYMTDPVDSNTDVFVLKLNKTDYSLAYSTYIGGGNAEEAGELIIDTSGNAYITGSTQSTDYPTVNHYQQNTDTDGNTNSDIIVSKFNLTGGLEYSTYIGGSGDDYGIGITINSTDCVIILGETLSTDYPTVNENMTDPGDAARDVVVTQLNQIGNSVEYSTYLGGNGEDSAGSIIIAGNDAYIVGYTASTNYPTVNPYMTDTDGTNTDIFLTKLNYTGNGIDFSTYIGGSLDDAGYGITLDEDGNVYLVGDTISTDFPTEGPYMTDPSDGNSDIVVLKLNSTGNGLNFSTYLGGSGQESGFDIALDTSNNTYITGFTGSTDYPTLNENMTDPSDVNNDVIVSVLNSTGDGLIYSTYIGGASSEQGWGIAIDTIGYVYIAGETSSLNYPTVDPYMTDPTDSNTDALITKLIFDVIAPQATITPSDFLMELGTASSVNWTVTDLHSGSYDFYVNGSASNTNVTWTSGIEISIPISPAVLGEINYTIVFRDEFGNQASDTVLVLVVDTTSPGVDSPSDFTYEQGSSSNALSWTAVDLDPDMYTVFINGSEFDQGIWSSGVPINVIINSVGEGNYNFTIQVFDSSANFDTDTVFVQIEDTIDPIVSSPQDMTVELGSSTDFIPWQMSDYNPDSYIVYRNGTIIENGVWTTNQTLSFGFSNFSTGTYNITIQIFDQSGRTASDTVFVTLIDTTDPVLSSPPDESFQEKTTGNVISWTPMDADNGTYEIYIDGVFFSNGDWVSGVPIELILDGLPAGTHEIEIIVTDKSGNSTSDTVVITITPSDGGGGGPLDFLLDLPITREMLIIFLLLIFVILPILLSFRGRKEEDDDDYY